MVCTDYTSASIFFFFFSRSLDLSITRPRARAGSSAIDGPVGWLIVCGDIYQIIQSGTLSNHPKDVRCDTWQVKTRPRPGHAKPLRAMKTDNRRKNRHIFSKGPRSPRERSRPVPCTDATSGLEETPRARAPNDDKPSHVIPMLHAAGGRLC